MIVKCLSLCLPALSKTSWLKVSLSVSLVLILSFGQLQAQDVTYNYQQLTINDGLASNQVYAGLQDQHGFLWFATSNGLNRYDGVKFTLISKKDGLQSNSIVSIAEDPKGEIWIVYGRFEGLVEPSGAIDIYNPITNTVTPFKVKYPDLPFSTSNGNHPNKINRVVSNENNELYFVRNDGTIFHLSYDGQIELDLKATEDLAVKDPNNSFRTREYKILNSQYLPNSVDDEALNYVNGQGDITKVRIQENESPPQFRIETQKSANEVNSTNTSPDAATYEVIKSNIIGKDIRTNRLFDPFSSAILLHHEDELFVYKNEKCAFLSTIINIRSREVSFFSDRQGNYWICTSKGLHKFSPSVNRFDIFFDRQSDSLSNLPSHNLRYQIRSIQADSLGNIWAGGQNGFSYFNKATESYQYNEQVELNNTFSLHKKGDTITLFNKQIYWFDLKDQNNLKKYKNAKFTQRAKEQLIWTALSFNDGQFLLGVQGLEFFNRKTKEHRILESCAEINSMPESIKHIFRIIYSNKDEHYWAVGNNGCYRISKELCITDYYGTNQELDRSHQLPVNELRDIYEDEDGIFWIATRSEGLLRWDRSTQDFQFFTIQNGLSSNNLYRILADEFGQLWISSDYGLVRFDIKTHRTTIYKVEDGIADNEFNRVSSYKADDGQFYFGGINGLTSFHPKDFVQDTTSLSAPLRITAFRQYDGNDDKIKDQRSSLLTNNKIVLKPGDRFFQLDFALLDFNSSNNTYKYLIEGIDDEWQYISEPSLRISGLPYGEYSLRIAGKSSDEFWSDQELSIPIQVLRPFYLKWYAYITYVLAFLAFLFFFRKFQIRSALEKAEQDKMIEIDALKTKLYTNITHEFRTPLTVIMGMADQILEDNQALIKSKPEEDGLKIDIRTKIDDHTGYILRNAKSLLQLINQILDLSKLEDSKMEMDWEHNDILVLLNYFLESFHSYAETKNISLDYNSNVSSLVMDFDRKKIQKVVANLLSNAIKFTPEYGKVSFDASHVAAKSIHEDNYLQIKVTNSGSEIPADQLNHIFERFYQVNSNNYRKVTNRTEGSGIGLAITKELVELMNGSISVKSSKDEGTVFTLMLPITVSAPISSEGKVSDLAVAQMTSLPLKTSEQLNTVGIIDIDTPLLLIIEDNADVADYIRICLEEDYKIIMASDGQQGIVLATEHIPDIIISDVMMPKKDGYEVTQQLKTDERTSHIPIILLTAKSSMDSRIEGIQRGADAYLTKPFDKKELQVRVSKLIELRKRLQSYYALEKPKQITSESTIDVTKEGIDIKIENTFLDKVHLIFERELSNVGYEIPEMSKELAMSHSQMYRKIKAITGQTIVAYFRNYRLHNAKEMLENSQLSISEIAYTVGFSSSSYFSSKFSEAYGFPPRENKRN